MSSKRRFRMAYREDSGVVIAPAIGLWAVLLAKGAKSFSNAFKPRATRVTGITFFPLGATLAVKCDMRI